MAVINICSDCLALVGPRSGEVNMTVSLKLLANKKLVI